MIERHEDTFQKLVRLDGFLKATILKRTVVNGVEFLIVTAPLKHLPAKMLARL